MSIKNAGKIACLLNSRVDSYVAASLMKRHGFKVVGVSVDNPFIPRHQNEQILERNEKVARENLQIPWKLYTPSKKELDPFQRAVASDLTIGLEPQLDILFNKHITYGCVFEHALLEIGADAFATPHYVRTELKKVNDGIRFSETNKEREYFKDSFQMDGDGVISGMRLLRAIDPFDDESFSLCQVVQKTLQKCMFPLGDFPRDLVLQIAEESKYPTLELEDDLPEVSSDPFAIIDNTLKDFDKNGGQLVNITNRENLGTHSGFHRHHIGELCKIGTEQYYVVEKDSKTGQIFVARDKEHPSTYRDTLFTTMANWTFSMPYHFYFRKQMMDTKFQMGPDSPATNCTLTVGNMMEWCGNNHLILSSTTPMHMVVPGHFCAFYDGDECIGSGKITKAGPSHFAMNYQKLKHLKDEPHNSGGITFADLFKKFTT